jgi:2-polyprenyl-3-methyl-5-hydroxy-6-metoxy-1,4-benzoquinol methylase
MKIKEYIEKNFNLKDLEISNNSNFTKEDYLNAKVDAIQCLETIHPYLNKDKKILEVGGGMHLLTNFLQYKNFNVTSIEPGNFYEHILRNKVLKKKNSNIHTTTLEEFKTNEKYDFIFSMNVLEHTKDIKYHIEKCTKLLKDKNSILFIQCPNYIFPFEPHFYEFFIPFKPDFTFKKVKKNKLIKKLGKERYFNILNNLNFKCTYFEIKKLKLSIQFLNPLANIFERIEKDDIFRKRILQNMLTKLIYKVIIKIKLKNLFIKLLPVSLSPYLTMKIIKK